MASDEVGSGGPLSLDCGVASLAGWTQIYNRLESLRKTLSQEASLPPAASPLGPAAPCQVSLGLSTRRSPQGRLQASIPPPCSHILGRVSPTDPSSCIFIALGVGGALSCRRELFKGKDGVTIILLSPRWVQWVAE